MRWTSSRSMPLGPARSARHQQISRTEGRCPVGAVRWRRHRW
ncbi:hypothetical protein HMPREF9056_01962 [Actinomyces sp. oral taxon 170 str. F0386]|nr:hypothetical protein HMPREF9056_01962 [Actinomyces sp. oral taxon 170 str. F0386]